MNKLISKLLLIWMIIGLTGCGYNWMNLDASKASNEKVKSALQKCNFEEERKKANRYLAGSHTDNEQRNIRMKSLHEETWANAKKCMESEGLKLK